jgi:hypothetical protein
LALAVASSLAACGDDDDQVGPAGPGGGAAGTAGAGGGTAGQGASGGGPTAGGSAGAPAGPTWAVVTVKTSQGDPFKGASVVAHDRDGAPTGRASTDFRGEASLEVAGDGFVSVAYEQSAPPGGAGAGESPELRIVTVPWAPGRTALAVNVARPRRDANDFRQAFGDALVRTLRIRGRGLAADETFHAYIDCYGPPPSAQGDTITYDVAALDERLQCRDLDAISIFAGATKPDGSARCAFETFFVPPPEQFDDGVYDATVDLSSAASVPCAGRPASFDVRDGGFETVLGYDGPTPDDSPLFGWFAPPGEGGDRRDYAFFSEAGAPERFRLVIVRHARGTPADAPGAAGWIYHDWSTAAATAPVRWNPGEHLQFAEAPQLVDQADRFRPTVGWRTAEGGAEGDVLVVGASWAPDPDGGADPGRPRRTAWQAYLPPARAAQWRFLDLGPELGDRAFAGTNLVAVSVDSFDLVPVAGFEAFLASPGPGGEGAERFETFGASATRPLADDVIARGPGRPARR